jgi:hypothetical protein
MIDRGRPQKSRRLGWPITLSAGRGFPVTQISERSNEVALATLNHFMLLCHIGNGFAGLSLPSYFDIMQWRRQQRMVMANLFRWQTIRLGAVNSAILYKFIEYRHS